MPAKGITDDGAASRLKLCLEVLIRHEPVNWGDCRIGNKFSTTRDRLEAGLKNNSLVHAVYDDPEKVVRVLEELQRLGTGLSVVVSGLFDRVRDCARRAGADQHTVNMSLGIHGNTTRLPRNPLVMAINTMCGHAMISFNLISALADRVAGGLMAAEEAAVTMARNCHCGIFNTRRAAVLIGALAAGRKACACGCDCAGSEGPAVG
ncbi:MAG: hypothetical protein RDU83_12855 [bacterium]|nr:hypothetical protein [bacterium]